MFIPPWSITPRPREMPMLTSWDYDGTLTTGKFSPDPSRDIVLTGRCIDEAHIVYKGLRDLGIHDIPVYFNPMRLYIRGNFNEESRIKSAYHKVNILHTLSKIYDVTHFDDDPIQLKIIKRKCRHVKLEQVESDGNYYAK